MQGYTGNFERTKLNKNFRDKISFKKVYFKFLIAIRTKCHLKTFKKLNYFWPEFVQVYFLLIRCRWKLV